ncbi:carbonic anhydrase [Oceanobacillus caeni]|uniref:beta-class carbonic anhydrase n=1 Tax=Bacillaceae TaxID=186817 RepID=UPI000622B434|nr:MULTISPECIES: carbonic anhydrase [Bacillaceae]KKE79151.1 carbonic anhydrase [Bacilli bacterium VT-13-104]PZD87636.1 carbonic anhydrase [Bacilli bacterium]MBU8790409.1 carbonic anhydrase [Oceanobacillus caeni]MCR1836215.1 carbonic anhydrase [Oceanobacillus caeni]PZD90674.1 carbonic anhydrase [Bacilli bacterium]
MHLDEMLEFNRKFVESKEYEAYTTDTYPNKKMVIFTCMESRLIELLQRSLNIQNGDVKMVKNAGAIIRKPFDSIMKSILVAIYNLKADEVVVIGHHDCGMSHVNVDALTDNMIERGIKQETIDTLKHSGIDFDDEFHGFNTVEESVEQSVEIIRNHPLLPKGIKVHGLVIDPGTGKVDVVTRED